MATIWQGGGIPLGYRYDEDNKVLMLDPHFKHIVKLIYSLAQSKSTALEIAEELNKRKIKSKLGASWSYKTISYLFTPQKIMFYAGYKDNNPGNWPAIITKAEADKIIKSNPVTVSKSRPRKNIFLLPGLNIAYCGYCGGKLKSSITQRSKNTSYYYLCSNKQMRGASYCPQSKVINQKLLNDKIIATILTQHKNLKNIQKQSAIFSAKSLKASQPKLNSLSEQINQLLAKQSKTNNTAELKTIHQQLDDLINERSSILTDQIIDINFNELYKVDLKTFHKFSVSKQQSIIKQYIKKIVVKTDTITIEFPFVINDKGSKAITIGH